MAMPRLKETKGVFRITPLVMSPMLLRMREMVSPTAGPGLPGETPVISTRMVEPERSVAEGAVEEVPLEMVSMGPPFSFQDDRRKT